MRFIHLTSGTTTKKKRSIRKRWREYIKAAKEGFYHFMGREFQKGRIRIGEMEKG